MQCLHLRVESYAKYININMRDEVATADVDDVPYCEDINLTRRKQVGCALVLSFR